MIPAEVAERYARASAWTAETLSGRAAAVCAREAGRVALVAGGSTWTFADLWARIERLAGHLVQMGIEPGHVVSWQLPNLPEAAIVHHAILRAGAVPNPLPPAFRARELRAICAEARPRLLVTVAGAPEDGLAPSVLDLDGVRALLDSPAPPPPPPAARAEDLALLLYTSGTAAAPKGVLHTHRALLCELDSFVGIHRLSTDDRYLGGAPVTHIAGLAYGVLAPLALGTSTALLERWEPAAAREAIARDGATFQTGPPTLLLTLADAAPGPADGFRLFSTGGASIHTASIRDAAARLGCAVKRAYGSTEVPTLTACLLDDDEEVRLGTDGRAIGEGEVRIVDGEIWARAPEMFAGYLGAPDPFEPGGWFRTGDLGVVDARGFLRVTGRLKDIIIRGGENVSALEVEELLAEHTAVAEAAVIGVPDPVLGERVCAVVVVRAGASFGFDEMVAHLLARDLSKRKLPERLEIVRALPRNANGKVLKDRLRADLSG